MMRVLFMFVWQLVSMETWLQTTDERQASNHYAVS
jgi:hypothetical protein